MATITMIPLLLMLLLLLMMRMMMKEITKRMAMRARQRRPPAGRGRQLQRHSAPVGARAVRGWCWLLELLARFCNFR